MKNATFVTRLNNLCNIVNSFCVLSHLAQIACSLKKKERNRD